MVSPQGQRCYPWLIMLCGWAPPQSRHAIKALADEGASESEKMHLTALANWVTHGSMAEALVVWEDILSRHPRDELALKFTHDAYFFLVFTSTLNHGFGLNGH